MASYDVFTPTSIATKMVSYFPKSVVSLLEPSVGTGNLLTAMNGRYERADVFDINSNYLSNIPESRNITKKCENFLTAPNKMYDAILMNPPYLRFQEIDSDTRRVIRKLSPVLKSGNVDLYMAFLVKCIECLSNGGKLVAIVPSTWLYNKSCALFRNHLITERLIQEIHDYGHEKVFAGIDVYCCILVLSKTPKTAYIRDGIEISYEATDAVTCGSLRDIANIQNGIATLCDEVFIHDTIRFDEPCWKPIFKVSKNVVRYIIFPYTNEGVIIPEDEFKTSNPQTYEFLLTQRAKLANRDRGNKKYEMWYALGRKQGLAVPAIPQSVYISTLCEESIPCTIRESTLFYSGVRLTPITGNTCETICKIVADNAPKLKTKCSKRAGGWLNMTVSVLKEVPVRL